MDPLPAGSSRKTDDALAPRLLEAVVISPLYLQLFSVDLAGVAMQVLMLAVFNVLFYLDQPGGKGVIELPCEQCQAMAALGYISPDACKKICEK